MSVYYFHLYEGTDIITDEEGREYESLSEAVSAAHLDVRSILSGDVQHGRLDLSRKLAVEDQIGTVLHELHFNDAIEIIT